MSASLNASLAQGSREERRAKSLAQANARANLAQASNKELRASLAQANARATLAQALRREPPSRKPRASKLAKTVHRRCERRAPGNKNKRRWERR